MDDAKIARSFVMVLHGGAQLAVSQTPDEIKDLLGAYYKQRREVPASGEPSPSAFITLDVHSHNDVWMAVPVRPAAIGYVLPASEDDWEYSKLKASLYRQERMKELKAMRQHASSPAASGLATP